MLLKNSNNERERNKKHHVCAYHRIKTMAVKVIIIKHMKSREKYSDIMTKSLAGEVFHSLVKPFLFRKPKLAAVTLKEEYYDYVNQASGLE